MKSFTKFGILALFPLLVISMISIVIAGSFADFKPLIIIFTILFFTIISSNYVYVFERLEAKGNPFFKSIMITATIVFISIFGLGGLTQVFFFNNFSFFTTLFQGFLAVIILLLLISTLHVFKSKSETNTLKFKEKPQIYLAIILAISSIETLFLSIFSIELLKTDNLDFIYFCFQNFLLLTLAITSLAMLCLYIFNQFKYTRPIYISIILTVLATYFSIYIFTFVIFKGYTNNINFIFIAFSSTILFTVTIIYRNKKQQFKLKMDTLTNSLSKKEFEYLQLKNQVNPHFLFNNLNTLISFIEIEPKKAIEFGHNLSNVYRHYLKNETEDFVLLSEELNFISEYLEIYKAKFESGFSFEIDQKKDSNQYILSLTLQEIIDNIFKHNILDDEKPIKIKIQIKDDYLYIFNSINLQKNVVSNKTGLININERNKILTNNEIIVTETKSYFEVKIPIINLEN